MNYCWNIIGGGESVWVPTGLEMCEVKGGKLESNVLKNRFNSVARSWSLLAAVCLLPVMTFRPLHISQTLFCCNCFPSLSL